MQSEGQEQQQALLLSLLFVLYLMHLYCLQCTLQIGQGWVMRLLLQFTHC